MVITEESTLHLLELIIFAFIADYYVLNSFKGLDYKLANIYISFLKAVGL